MQVLRKSVCFDRDMSAKTSCGLILTGTFITFVIPTGPAGNTHVCVCVRARAHARTQERTHARTHTHTHTHTHTRPTDVIESNGSALQPKDEIVAGAYTMCVCSLFCCCLLFVCSLFCCRLFVLFKFVVTKVCLYCSSLLFVVVCLFVVCCSLFVLLKFVVTKQTAYTHQCCSSSML